MNPARRETILNFIGLGLLVLCFLLSAGRVASRYFHSDEREGKMTLRFSQWQLESGVREALNLIAADYMALHPDVTIEQLPVPERVYLNWLRTQLVGRTAPEIVEIDFGRGGSAEILGTYFEPLTEFVQRPNPYNAGNDLARTPWKETFVDGLTHAYNQELLQYYSVPSCLYTVRMFYNVPLWREIFGPDKAPPRNYEEMLAVCRRAAAYRTGAGEPVIPLAGALSNAPIMIQRLFSSQTQRLSYTLARPDEITPTTEELGLDFLSGRWSYDRTPAVRDGLELARGLGQFLPPGFLQLKREDALFLFSQGRALMTVCGSWDAPSIRSQAPFEIGVFNVPLPAPDGPRYGPNTVGTVSEAGNATELRFAVPKGLSAERRARAIDFLQFLTSRDANRKFSQRSGWLPSVVGIEPSAELKAFVPHMAGYPPGFTMGINLSDSYGNFGAETGRLMDTNLYQLFAADGSVEGFARAIAGPVRTALIHDFSTNQRNQNEAIARQDTMLAAYHALADAAGPGKADARAEKFSELDELQAQEEISVARRRWSLNRIGVALEP